MLVFWEEQVVKLEELKLCNTLDFSVKVKTNESKFWPIATVKCEDEVSKCDKCEVRLS